MSFLDEKITVNLEKGDKLPSNLPDDSTVNYMEEESPHSQGYGKDPKTGKFKPMSSADAIQRFLDKIKQSVEDEAIKKEEKADPVVGLLSKAASSIRKAGGAQYKTPFTDLIDSFDELIKGKKDKNEQGKLAYQLNNIHKAPQDKFDNFIKKMEKDPEADKDLIKSLIKKQKEYIAKQDDAKRKKEEEEYEEGAKENNIKEETMKEAKDIELPSDTTFTLDLKHLVKKHMNKGNDKESAIKFTKALMKKLHDKGEVEVNGTKVMFKETKLSEGNLNQGDIVYLKGDYNKKSPFRVVGTRKMFDSDLLAYEVVPFPMGGFKVEYDETQLVKEADAPVDTQLALPEPDAPDFLGDDGMDYEGGMAKSQMLKMKKYVDALSNMIEDESQLESWVQAKLTKASDYMSAVYHYLDYQKSKMEEK